VYPTWRVEISQNKEPGICSLLGIRRAQSLAT